MKHVSEAAKVLTAMIGLGSACVVSSSAVAGYYGTPRHSAGYGMHHAGASYARHIVRHAYGRMGARYGYGSYGRTRSYGYARPFTPSGFGYARHDYQPSYALARSYQRPLYDGERHHFSQYRQDYADNLGFGPSGARYYGAPVTYGYPAYAQSYPTTSYSYVKDFSPSIFSGVTAGYNAGFDPGYGLCVCR